MSQHTHYYKSARLEKLVSPVKKNEKPLLELLHPRMEIPTLSTANSKARAYDDPEDPIHSGHCAVQEPCDLGTLGTI